MKVLHVDDSPQICDMYADMFKADDSSIQSVNDAKTGLQLVVENDYDLILLDIRMPEYNGIDFLQDLKKQRPSELKKIVVTSMLEFPENQIKELMEFGIHSVEKKPSNFQQLETLQKDISQKKRAMLGQSLKILIIDHQPENTNLLSEFLNSKGFQTTVTNDPWEGFRFIQNEQFDVILLDMYMPEFSGLQIINMLATDEILEDQNIFILPAAFDHNKQIKELTKRDGISGCFNKPLNLNEILTTITKDFKFQLTTPSEKI